MTDIKRNHIKKLIIILSLFVFFISIFIVSTLASKKSYAAVGNLTYTGDRYSSDLGYNMQAAENYYRFSVGTSIRGDDIQQVDGIYTSTSNKVTISLTMERKDTGLNKGYAIFVSMFYRIEKYSYQTCTWEAWEKEGWRAWFCASVHKSGNSTHYFDGINELKEMRNRGQYPDGTVYAASGDDKIDLRDSYNHQVLCKDLFEASPSRKGRLTEAASADNTGYSFDLTEDGKYRIAITAIGWRWEMGESAGRRWNIDGDKRITSSEFIIDHDAPKGTLTYDGTGTSLSDGSYTNKNVRFSWEINASVNTTATLDGISYDYDSEISSEGKHTIILKDVAQETKYTFVIDKTAPMGKLTGVTNNGYTSKDVLFEWDKAGENEAPIIANISRNDGTGVSYVSGTKITAEGEYIIVLSDLAGNWREYSFTIDKTAPVGLLTTTQEDGFGTDNYTNGNVTFSWSNDEKATAKLNGVSYSGATVSIEGSYTLVLTDRANNSTTYNFIIDKTAPTGLLSTSQDGGFRKNKNTSGNVTFFWSDKNAAAKLNGNNYISGEKVTSEGNYTLILTDKANNNTVYTFVIDKTAPTGSFNGVNSNGYSNSNVTFTWSEDADTVAAKLNGVGYSKGQTIYREGSYKIVLTDLAENSTTYTFIIDKTAPTGTLFGVSNGGYTNCNVRFEWSENESTATLNGNAYISGQLISEEHFYSIILTDLAENSTTYTFVIDKTAPTGTLFGVSNGGYTNCNVRFEWSDTKSTATLNNKIYTSGTLISDETAYTIKLTDKANNITTYTFVIDKTAPLIETGVADFEHTCNDVKVIFTDTYTVQR